MGNWNDIKQPKDLKPEPAPVVAAPSAPSNGIVQFIDISKYQPVVKWDRVKTHGFAAVVAKCVDGADGVDPMYSKHHEAARAFKLPFGAYCFNRFHADPVLQADHFVRTVGDTTRWLIADIEFDKSSRTVAKFGDKYIKGMDDYAADHSIKFLERVTALTGVTPWIYLNAYHFVGFKNPERFLKYPCWISNYLQKRSPVEKLDVSKVHLPKPYTKAIAWQWTDAHEAGRSIVGGDGLDANIAYLSIDQLRALANA